MSHGRPHLERERKLQVWAGFELPELGHLADGVVATPLPDQQLEATYYDTDDLRLARSGISVRFRTGESCTDPKRGKWTVKLPGGEKGPALVRREIDVEAPGRVVPDQVSSLVRAHVRSSLLAPVGTLATRRRRVELQRDGLPLVEVADDEVSVLSRRRVALRFREVEVELVDPGATELMSSVGDALVAAGAVEVEQVPKIVRALGPRALDPPEVVTPDLDGSVTVAEVVRAAIAEGFLRLIRHDPGIRLGGDNEDVHQARVAARRLRSDLRTFRSVLDTDRAQQLRDELQWLGAELGLVRDADVLHERLRLQTSLLPPSDTRAATALLRRLETERARARSAALAALESDRYLALLDALVAAVELPPVEEEAAFMPAGKALPGIVRGPWRHLQKAVESLGDDPEDEALHEIRIRAKRVRYAAEASAGVMGDPARRFAKAAAGLQSVLGEMQDAVVAEAWLRAAGAKGPPSQALVAGQLICLQLQAMDEARRGWPDAWDGLAAKKLRAWLS